MAHPCKRGCGIYIKFIFIYELFSFSLSLNNKLVIREVPIPGSLPIPTFEKMGDRFRIQFRSKIFWASDSEYQFREE